MTGRIRFPGNPWPDGHAVESFSWGAAIHPSHGLLLEFSLKSEDYYAADGEMSDHIGPSDWESKIAWCNYHACTLGPSQTSSRSGLLVPSPFTLGLDRYEFTADPLPVDWDTFFDTNAFGIYLLGHDAVADHRIRLELRGDAYVVDWTGRIALAYMGATDFRYSFEAHVEGVRFDSISMWYFKPEIALEYLGLEVDPALSPRDYLAPYVSDPDRFDFEERNGTLHAVWK